MSMPISGLHSSRLPELPLETINSVTRPTVRRLLDQYLEEMGRYRTQYIEPPKTGHWRYSLFDEPALDQTFEPYLLRDNRLIAGFIFLHTQPDLHTHRDVLEVRELYVDPSFRRRRLATTVVDSLKRLHEQRRLRAIVAHVYRTNVGAITFWRRQGFVFYGFDRETQSESYAWPATTRALPVSGTW